MSTQTVKCQTCGMRNPRTFEYCPSCGTALQPSSKSPPSISPRQTVVKENTFKIPTEYQSRLNQLLNKDDTLVAWYSVPCDRTSENGSWHGNGVAFTREKLIFFSNGCISGVQVLMTPRRQWRSVREEGIEIIIDNFGEPWSVMPLDDKTRDELLRLLVPR